MALLPAGKFKEQVSLSATAIVVGLRSRVAWFFVLSRAFVAVLWGPKDNFSIERQRLKHQIESVAISVGKCRADVAPPVILAFAFDNGIGLIDRI